jgi:hypothetical protein
MAPERVQVTAEFHGGTPVDILRTYLFDRAYEAKETLYSDTVRGYISSSSYDRLKSIINNKHTSRLIFRALDEEEIFEIYEMTNGLVQVVYDENRITVELYCCSEPLLSSLVTEIRKCLSDAPKRGTIHLLVHEQESFRLSQLGEAQSPLERGNYTPDVLKQYDAVLADLTTNDPVGRMTLLNGIPGSGKSYLIRGLVTATNGLFIYVPAALSGYLTGPDIIPVLLREKDKDVPIVLLMEDADVALASRKLDTVARLSDLLNMTDGMLGDMADLRIIATTNCSKKDIDEAVYRDGRLNEYIQLGHLTEDHALDIFNRLVPTEKRQKYYPLFPVPHFGPKTVLANVYREARKYGWRPAPNPNRSKRRNSPGFFWDC